MALSNILNEPQREVTESVVGLALLAMYFVCDYSFALWFCKITAAPNNGCFWIVVFFIGPLLTLVIVAALFATHAIGESICNALERRGVRLRPSRER